MKLPAPVLAVGLLATVVGALATGAADAQQVFRSVDSDGRVTFSDTRSPSSVPAGGVPVATVPAVAGSELGGLPFELRQAVGRYPVTLYSGTDCAPCAAGRSMLVARGIPFTEKSVSTAEDVESLKRIATVSSLPLLTIGGQQLKGYSEVEWAQFLDAAGYPKSSQLPAGYQPPPATPLVVAHEPQAPAPPKPTAESASRAAAPATPVEPANPSGIRF